MDTDETFMMYFFFTLSLRVHTFFGGGSPAISTSSETCCPTLTTTCCKLVRSIRGLAKKYIQTSLTQVETEMINYLPKC